MSSLLYRWFHPTIDAIFSTLPFSTRLRLLLFQPLALLVYTINTLPNLFTRRYHSIAIPTRKGSLHAIVFESPASRLAQRPRPLHLDIHGGAFIGGHPEANIRFCTYLADTTGALIISTSYRFAPRHPFPAAIDDVDDVISYLLAPTVAKKFNIDTSLFTIAGSSAGGNLALAACLHPQCHGPSATAVKAVCTFYAPIDCRIPPKDKPKPEGFPRFDPLSWMLPLYDSYASTTRPGSITDARCNPILAETRKLPSKILMVVPTVDILVHEQLSFIERVNAEIRQLVKHGKKEGSEIEALIMEGCWHGWLELPSAVIKEDTRTRVFERCAAVIREAHRTGGWVWRGVDDEERG